MSIQRYQEWILIHENSERDIVGTKVEESNQGSPPNAADIAPLTIQRQAEENVPPGTYPSQPMLHPRENRYKSFCENLNFQREQRGEAWRTEKKREFEVYIILDCLFTTL